MLLFVRFNLFSVQLVCVSAVAKCFTPSSVMLLTPRSKLFSVQLVCVSAVAETRLIRTPKGTSPAANVMK